MPEKRASIWVGLVVIFLISLPYLYAFQQNTPDAEFGGFLINPLDGHSYLAKMQIGYRGDWLFDLPYSAQPAKGALLFFFYILLGHISRISGLSLIFIFHAARIVSAVVLVISIRRFFRAVFDEPGDQARALALGLLGSGLGWIAALGGYFTSDLWVAEAFPFLSAYTNPHFTLGLALMIRILTPGARQSFLTSIVFGFLLAVIQPFGVVIAVLVRLVVAGMEVLESRNWRFSSFAEAGLFPLLGLGLGGGVFLLYQYFAIQADPILSVWNEQNVTPSPPLIDLLFSLSPALILAVIGCFKAWKDDRGRRMVVWAGLSLLLLIVPWNLQRRFIGGLYFPLAGLSIFGLKLLTENTGLKIKTGFLILLVLSLPTNLIVILSGMNAAKNRDEMVFIDSQTLRLLDWIEAETAPDSVLLADRDAGLLIPSFTGRRVVYGHPFESIHAAEEIQFLDSVKSGDQTAAYYRREIDERGVDFLILRDQPAGGLADWIDIDKPDTVYSRGGDVIYLTRSQE